MIMEKHNFKLGHVSQGLKIQLKTQASTCLRQTIQNKWWFCFVGFGFSPAWQQFINYHVDFKHLF